MATEVFNFVDGAFVRLDCEAHPPLWMRASVVSSVVLTAMDELFLSSLKIVAENLDASDRPLLSSGYCLANLLSRHLGALEIAVFDIALDIDPGTVQR